MDAGGAYDFATAAPMLPGLLGGLTGAPLVMAGHVGVFTLKHLGYPDLARDAARLAVTEARDLGDPAWIGVAEFTRVLAMPPEMPGAPARLAQRVADEIQPHLGERTVREAYGMLHLHAALRTAVDGRPDAALDHLAEARELADSLGEPAHFGLGRFAFGPTNVGIWTTSILLELGRPHHAIEAAATVRPGMLPLANRQTPFYVDLGTALAAVGKDDEAIAAFLRAEAAGPQFVRLRPTVRDTITSIVRRTKRNAVTRQMRLAATAVGADHLVRDR
jgi:tetratricopeptide (TPR) repeat protein